MSQAGPHCDKTHEYGKPVFEKVYEVILMSILVKNF